MIVAIYTGTFDPITKGHQDIIERSSKMVDKLVVVISDSNKNNIFTQDERFQMLQDEIKHLKNVEVEKFDGLIVDFLKTKQANFLIRGIRNMTDFDHEMSTATINKKLYKGVETLFIPASENTKFISSSALKKMLALGGDISDFVSENIKNKIEKKLK